MMVLKELDCPLIDEVQIRKKYKFIFKLYESRTAIR